MNSKEWAEYSRSGHAPSLEDCFAGAMDQARKKMPLIQTDGKLRCRNNVGAGRELQALLPKGFKLDCTDQDHGIEEEAWRTVWYERWVQFATPEWEALQDEIMQAIQEVIDKREAANVG